MKKAGIVGALFVVIALGAGFLMAYGDTKGGSETIRVVERAGYFETHGNVYNREAGPVVFTVENESGKDAGFVLTRSGQKPLAIGIKKGQTGRLEVDLEPGSYEYYCPIIPTARYPLTVK